MAVRKIQLADSVKVIRRNPKGFALSPRPEQVGGVTAEIVRRLRQTTRNPTHLNWERNLARNQRNRSNQTGSVVGRQSRDGLGYSADLTRSALDSALRS